MTTKSISSSSTLIWGILSTVTLIIIFFIILFLSPLNLPNWFKIIICIGFPILVFVNGFTSIGPTQTGLLNIFGTRQKISISEGYTWLPPFTSVRIFNNKEQTTDIGEIEILSTNQISIKIKLGFNWRIIDNYQFSNLDENDIERALSELIKNGVRNEIINNKLNDITLINSEKLFVEKLILICNQTAEKKWGVLISELFITAIRPSTDSMRTYYESKAKLNEIAEDSAKLARILNISPKDALDKYARERLKISSIENIYSMAEISQITILIEKLLRK